MRLVVTFIIIIFLLTFTAKLCITASRGTISNKCFLFLTICTINGRAVLKFTASLMKTFGIPMASTVVVTRALSFFSIKIY